MVIEKYLNVNTAGPFPIHNTAPIGLQIKSNSSCDEILSPFQSLITDILTTGGVNLTTEDTNREDSVFVLAGSLSENPMNDGFLFQAVLTDAASGAVYWHMTLLCSSIDEMVEKYYLIYRKMFER